MSHHPTPPTLGRHLVRGAILFGVLVLSALSLSACRRSNAAPTGSRTKGVAFPRIVQVNGSAQIDVAPDVVDVSIRLSLTRPTPKAAMEELERRKGKLLESLQAASVQRKEVQLGQITLSPDYERYPSHKLRGFRAQLEVSVCLSKFERLTAVMQAAANANAAAMGTRFRSTKMQPTKVRARILAVKAARKKADQLASSLGVRLGRVVTIRETQASNWGRLSLANEYVRPTATTKPLQPGAIAVSLSVYVEFEIL
ncbi:MAG: SIMPL domain-containing protein [Myxococcales bacterium]|nr:SIMPL domain-containing protein [Myxococcales bacterium]